MYSSWCPIFTRCTAAKNCGHVIKDDLHHEPASVSGLATTTGIAASIGTRVPELLSHD